MWPGKRKWKKLANFLKENDTYSLLIFMSLFFKYITHAVIVFLLFSCSEYRENKIRNEYCKLKSEKEAFDKFSADLEKGALKYFYRGYNSTADMAKDWKSKYNIRIIDTRNDLCAGYLWYNKYIENYVASASRKCCVKPKFVN